MNRVESALPHPGPRERLWTHGPAVLADDELIAILLGTGRNGTPVLELARELLSEAGMHGLPRLSTSGLARRVGIGPAKASRLVAAFELGRRALAAPLLQGARLSSPAAVAAVYGPRLSGLGEQFVVVHLDARHRVISEATVARGGVDRCPVPIRELLAGALEAGAQAILCIHNHPSGDVEPSAEDRRVTERLQAAGQLLGLPLLDHVIVAGRRHASLRERGWLSSLD